MAETIELAPGYAVSRLTKGNWQLSERHGPMPARAEAIEGMARFVEAGFTNFDCADHYVGVEEMIGEFRRAYPELAARTTVQTKIVPDRDVLGTVSRADLEALVDRSRRRLGVDALDLVQFHWWDYEVPRYVDCMLWLAELQAEGRIRHLGVTNFDREHLAHIVDAGVTVVSNQVQYSVLDRRPESGMAAFCRERGIGLQCYGTIAGGFLAKRWLGAEAPRPPFENRSLVKYHLIIEDFGGWELFQDMLAALDSVARRHGVSPTAVATRWVLDRPGVATAIVGARTGRHLADLLAVDTLRLDEADRAAIGAVIGRAVGPTGDCYDLEREVGGRHMSIMWMNQNLQGAGAR